GRGPERRRGAGNTILTKSGDRFMAQLRQASGMPNRGPLRAELRVLAGMGIRRAQLFQLPAQVLLLTLSPGSELVEIAHRADRRRPLRMRGGHSSSHLDRPRIAVKKLGLCVRVEQRVVLVLAVQRAQATSELAQLAGAGGAPVDARSAALAELPEEDDGVASRLEDTLDRRLFGA